MKDETDILEVHAIVKGRVQGVGFRATAQHFANKTGIFGTVRNMPEGHVEIFAQGEKVQLDEFLKKIQDYFSTEIHDIDLDYRTSVRLYDRFSVIF
jgi:acylphosphatase